MAIAINLKTKVTLPFCTKAGNSPYNKGGCEAKIAKDKIVDIYDYREAKLVILRPVIDKLIFAYNFQDCGSAKTDIKDVVLKNIEKILKEIPGKFKNATKHNVGNNRFNELRKNYKENFVLVHKPTGSKIIIQVTPCRKTGAFLRCELNPARLGPEGIIFFKAFFELLTSNKWLPITFDTMAKREKIIKRIDVAVDMLGVDASDLEGRYVFKGKQLKKKPIQNPTGRVETMYFQMPENDKNQAYWYNKTVQIKETAQDPLDGGQKSPYGDALYTRFEYRIEETDKPIANLHSFLNHLPKVHFRAVDYSKIKGKDFTHALFLRYALSRTRGKALELVPEHLRAEYADSYDEAIVDIWRPEEIWEKGWHPELISLGLLDPKKLKKKKVKTKVKTSG